MDGAISKRVCERGIDEAVLLDERAAVEVGALYRDVEMVAAARTIDDVDLMRVRKRVVEQRAERLDGHSFEDSLGWGG